MVINEPEECFDVHMRILQLHGWWPSKKNGRINFADLFLRIIRYFPSILIMAASFTHTIVKYQYIEKILQGKKICSIEEVIIETEGYFRSKNKSLTGKRRNVDVDEDKLKKKFINVNDKMADDVTTIFLSLFSVYVFVTTSLSQNDIITLMEELKDFRLFGEPSGLKQLIRKQKRLIYVVYIYGIIGGLMYVVACYLLSSHCQSLNKVYAKTCGLPFPLILPFEVDLNVKLFIIIIQMIVGLYQLFLPMITLACALAAIMENMQLRLKHVREAVASVAMAETFEERKDLLKFCLKYYNNVLRFEKLHEKYIGNSTAFHVFLPGLIMGTLNYKIYYDMQTRDILNLIPWIFIMSLLCHAGQGLLDESAKLSTEIYNLPWYDFEPVLKRSIILFLMRSQKPVKVKAGILHIFSYELLLKIVKSSFSFMTLLNQLSN